MLTVRPLRPSDGEQLGNLLCRLSLRSRNLRFMGPMPSPESPIFRYLVTIDPTYHDGVGVFVDGVLVGAAHAFRSADDPGSAELAVEIADEFQGNGLGGQLVVELTDVVRQRGVNRFTATVLTENHRMLSLLRRLAAPVVTERCGYVTDVRVDMTDRWPGGATRPLRAN